MWECPRCEGPRILHLHGALRYILGERRSKVRNVIAFLSGIGLDIFVYPQFE